MAPSVFKKAIGGCSSPNRFISPKLTQPRGPSKALKPAAATTVGKMNGKDTNVRSLRFPGKSKRPNT